MVLVCSTLLTEAPRALRGPPPIPGQCIDNPCDRIGPVLGPQHDVVQHMWVSPRREVAAAIRTARASNEDEAAAVPLLGVSEGLEEPLNDEAV